MLTVIYKPIGDLIPYARNSRTHSDAQVAQIAASIKEFGFTNPVLIDEDGGIIAGHGRILAARKLNIDEVPTITLEGLTKTQRQAYVIADNKLALNAGWDDELLKVEIEELQGDGFDIELLGFDADELANIECETGTEGFTDEDETPEVQAEAIAKPGDVWLLGKHRVMCGDSTDSDAVQNLLCGGVPHLMVTDPPYGVEYDADWRNNSLRADGTPIAGRSVGKVLNDDRADWREAWALFPGEVAYVWHGVKQCEGIAGQLRECGYEIRDLIVWAKSNLVIGRGHYHSKHETCWYAVKKGGTGHWQGDRKQTTLWEINKPHKSETGHSTQKPIECMRIPIENNSKAGDSIYDPFSGSGTTIIAAEQIDRRCYAMELSPNYVDVAVRRWQEFTGKQATLESTGATFADIEADSSLAVADSA